MRSRSPFVALFAIGTLLMGCTSGDDDNASTDATSAPSDGASDTTEAAPTGPSPGVTDTSIKVGITYVDLAAIRDVVNIDHGDYEAAFNALIDDINANGGINGRTIEAVFAPINPIGTDAADAACVQLTQDEQVFVVMGFFNADTVLCPLENQTAVIGGSMSDERLGRAQAPWFTFEAGTDLATESIQAMIDGGEFDGTLAVFGTSLEDAQVNDDILPLLEENGIEVVETAILDQGGEVDVAAGNAQTAVIAERFQAAGVDQVLAVGNASLQWANGTETLDYRPQLLLTDTNTITAYVTDEAGRDLSVLDGAVAGSLYGPADAIFELPQMDGCIQIIRDAGVTVPEPASIPEGGLTTYTAAMNSCNVIALFRALVEAAGDDLNYGTLVAAADGLQVEIPSQPDPLTYGAPPAADGDAPAFLYDWDPGTTEFALREN